MGFERKVVETVNRVAEEAGMGDAQAHFQNGKCYFSPYVGHNVAEAVLQEMLNSPEFSLGPGSVVLDSHDDEFYLDFPAVNADYPMNGYF